jgi:GxxExxY protein
MDLDRIGTLILDAAFTVHRTFGPGLLESAYQNCMKIEMQDLGLSVASQVPLPLTYKDQFVGNGYRADIIVNESVLVEVKSVEALNDIHIAQVITYLKLSNCRIGYLLNFNVVRMKLGIKRIII